MAPSRTSVVIFPFDLFGGAGTAEGALLVANELREILSDNRREKVSTRARAYQNHVQVRELEFRDLASLESWRRRGQQECHRAWGRDEFLVWIAGNHLATLPLYDELSDSKTQVIQLDAHLDIHHFADCAQEMSHGNFLLHCSGRLPPLINLGHRDLLLEPEYIAQSYQEAIPAAALQTNPEPILRKLRALTRKSSRVFLDIDWDVLDPGDFPAVAEPVPFGLSPELFLRVLDAVWSDRVVGVSLSEFDPRRDQNDRSLAMVMWFLEYLLLSRYEGQTAKREA